MSRSALAFLALGCLLESHASPVPLPLAPQGAAPGPGSQSNHWAVIVAGSNGYGNYRHQADAAHAYQRLLGSGIPASQIITFIDGGIANDPYNPVPGASQRGRACGGNSAGGWRLRHGPSVDSLAVAGAAERETAVRGGHARESVPPRLHLLAAMPMLSPPS